MRFLPFIVLIWMATTTYAQTSLDWSDLTGGISFQALSLEDPFPGFTKARFSEDLKALEGKEIVLTGYFLVLDGSQSVYMLSMNPMASCFFCGNGGPETVVGLQFAEKPAFKMDELLSVNGILRLNRQNPNEYYYRIENADAISFN
ncbi:hypothetical protein LV716_00030 [Flagellimonas sp. HMM57]|uniref:hypothetical protein n=1 Tax=unclassified Flagellimonas TaxID=2644544 RepID=UPI0013D021A9|nr:MULTISPECIES: hypothetical protein [unclassified Flagellimonas]UII76222.1 hypothetical protein LV716_00030 [Flagellimonas sp. HMM57]